MSINPKIQETLKEVAKVCGEGTAMILGESTKLDIKRISSGSLNFDLALGGGIPLGRTIEFFGPESGGKTTAAILACVQAQKAFPEKYALYVDVEHALDPKIIKEYGVNPDRLIISQPDTAEQAFDVAEAFIRSQQVSIVIVDSVSALVPSAEAKGEMSDQQMGLVARIMGKALRKLTGPANDYEVPIIFINQVREKIGVMFGLSINRLPLN